MKPKFKILILFPLLFVLGCPQSTLHKARVAVADIASGLNEADKAVQTLSQNGKLDKQETIQFEHFIREGTLLDDNLNDCVDLIKQGGNKAALDCSNKVVTQFKSNETQALIGIKDKDAQARMNIALAGVDAGILVLQDVMKSLGGK